MKQVFTPQAAPLRLLQVEDDPLDAKLFEKKLQSTGSFHYELTRAQSLQEALDALESDQFDVILLDLCLPDSYGLQTLDTMRDQAADRPIIVLTGSNDEEIALLAIQRGAQDYLVKGDIGNGVLTRAIRYAVDRKRAELQLMHLAQYDALTGLANRTLFEDRLTQAMLRAGRHKQALALLSIDLDRFKTINDNFGHDIGDKLLKEVALRLKSGVREEDTVARWGGDEFSVILENTGSTDAVAAVARNISKALSVPFMIDGYKLFTSVSIGISFFDGNEDCSVTELLKRTDFALYSVKHRGRNGYSFFSHSMESAAKRHLSLEQELREALERGEFFIEYQPQIDVRHSRLIGAEALIRWQHPQRGVVYPGEFVRVLEETGYIVPVGEWVLHQACRQWYDWISSGQLAAAPTISINLSGCQFIRYDIGKLVSSILHNTSLEARYLDLEITESTLLEINQANMDMLYSLKDRGINLSIDDFGTGYSSMANLKHFPIDRLKVDRSFITDILFEKKDAAIAASIIELARNLELDVIVEGVDHIAKLELLSSYGCNAFQGYYFSEPLSANEFIARYGRKVH